MRFVVKKEIFEELPSACFGVVMAKGIDNNNAYPEIEQFLDESIQAAMQRFEGRKVKEDPDILPYREAFRALNILSNIVLNELDYGWPPHGRTCPLTTSTKPDRISHVP